MHCHVLVSSVLQRGAYGIDDLLASMDEAGVEAAICSVIGDDQMSENDLIAAASRRHPGRLYGYINLDPRDPPSALAELARRAGDPRFVGIKLHPANHAYFPFTEQLRPVYAAIAKTGMPVLWHSGTYPNSTPLQIAAVALEHPGMPCVLGHFGLTDFAAESIVAARLAANVYADTSIQTSLPLLRAFVDAVGPERLLWGSDFPLYMTGYELAKVALLELAPAARELVTGGNARRIYRLGEP
jgi:predicted TIM-barrel fold metal-dependent hydrolase